MTMPHLMNCKHSETGWCLDCVKKLHDKKENLENLLDRFRSEVRMYCRPACVNYDVFPVFHEVDMLFN